MPELLTFKKFNDVALAQNLAAILDEHGIEYLIEESTISFNPTFTVRTAMSNEYAVKINSNDFKKTAKVLAEYENIFTNDVEPDYYLFSFTTDELMEIITKRDEWSEFDYALAKRLLDKKGIKIDQDAENRLSEQRLEQLKQPEHSENTWIVFGYLFAICGGILGFFIGWQLWTSRKTLPNGEQVYTYKSSDRKNGKRIFYISILGLLLGITCKVVYSN